LADISEFTSMGGYFQVKIAPQLGATGPAPATVEILMPEEKGPGWFTMEVEGRFTWFYGPADQIQASVANCLENAKREIREYFRRTGYSRFWRRSIRQDQIWSLNGFSTN
jgi:hypothetical protein